MCGGRCQGVRDSCPISEMGGKQPPEVLGALLAAQGGGAWGEERGMRRGGCFLPRGRNVGSMPGSALGWVGVSGLVS